MGTHPRTIQLEYKKIKPAKVCNGLLNLEQY